ncbi:MAG: metallophosphoesterase family protein [Chloroflexi bacterium]|nr:metallophosphoesterase family protein [Chloroflexota bacterium]
MTRVAVFSDMHGNAFAFEHVLAEIRRESCDHLVCLGDVIYGGPQPAETIALLRDLHCPVVRGNTDAWFAEPAYPNTNTDELNIPGVSPKRDFALSRMTDADRAFVGSFQPTVEIPLDGANMLLCFHGSPASYDDQIHPHTPYAEVMEMLEAHLPRIMCGGHVHTPFQRRLGDSGAFFFNPGAVGFVFNRSHAEQPHMNAFAEYAILTIDGARVSLEFRRVPYDLDAYVDIYRQSGLPNAEQLIAQYLG